LEREFSVAQIAHHHFLLIGFCETPRAESGPSLQVQSLTLNQEEADPQHKTHVLGAAKVHF
jgi:hypothetical protein